MVIETGWMHPLNFLLKFVKMLVAIKNLKKCLVYSNSYTHSSLRIDLQVS